MIEVFRKSSGFVETRVTPLELPERFFSIPAMTRAHHVAISTHALSVGERKYGKAMCEAGREARKVCGLNRMCFTKSGDVGMHMSRNVDRSSISGQGVGRDV